MGKKAIIFDLDGVITDTAEYHYLAWKQLADDLGLPFDRNSNERLKGISRMESLELILEAGNKELGHDEKERLAHKKNEHYKELIQQITPDDLLPGIVSFLTELSEAGFKIGMASASKNAQEVVRRLEVTSFFHVIVDAASVKKGKPDPEIFLTAAQLLEVEPNACIGVEDAQAGVQAIKSANMFAIGVGEARHLSEADWLVTSTEELSLKALSEHI
ncbi:beta-phosphoglucomutase [Pontibacillus halophilus JSM 076056 = DSM 19796]|uniref:Beta-phosphoglucomutase n=1 Tax=Pontibacillus halophilus JSM 076056 = DSM 19796 TaxID=1385510 RepID=A0A0A5GGJ9_9BACI|nr:beta-phosphoglucomutase [Pontibacillus halophilus]KGX90348.1 beta-phosphoglucomutase [Pontibacillus halophilus JSM 076056 = DSM 19796]